MFKNIHIAEALGKVKRKSLKEEDRLLEEARRILIADVYSGKNMLDNLSLYNESFAYLEEDDLDESKLFRLDEIKDACVKYRLRFLDASLCQRELPAEAFEKISALNRSQVKDIKRFKILGSKELFSKEFGNEPGVLFAETIYGNYYMVHKWGGKMNPLRMIWMYPLRNFESLFSSLALLSMVFALVTPTAWLTSDSQATYASEYRAAWFFHVLILAAAVSVFKLFSQKISFSSQEWKSVWENK